MNDFNLTFTEMTEKLFNKEGYGVGENFKHGVFLTVDNDDIIMKERKSNGIGYAVVGNPVLSKGLLKQKYKIIICASDKELGLA